MLTRRGPRNPCDFGEGTDFERRALEAFAVSLSQTPPKRSNAIALTVLCVARIIVCKHWSRSYYFGKLRLRSAIAHLPRCVWDTELARHLHHSTSEVHAHEEPLRCLVSLGGRQDDTWRAARRKVRQDRV